MKHLGPFVHPPRQDASPSQATPLPLDIFSALLVKASRKTKLQVVQRQQLIASAPILL